MQQFLAWAVIAMAEIAAIVDNKKIIAIVGSTATGKSELAIKLAQNLDAEIISADSMQIYKDVYIGTARLLESQFDGINHHMINFLDVDKNYSVSDYCKDASKIIEKILAKNKKVIVAGGTGLYVRSLLNGIKFNNDEIKSNFDYESLSFETLLEKLKNVDIDAYNTINHSNKRRIIRALEINEIYHMSKNDYDKMNQKNAYDYIMLGLTYENRNILYEKINARVDSMIEQGLEKEAKFVLKNGATNLKNAIGYKEWNLENIAQNDENLDIISKDFIIEKIKQHTRNYAKRQITWFKKDDVNWIYRDNKDFEQVTQEAMKILANNNIT